MNEMRARMGYRYAAIVRRPQHFQFCAQILRIVHGGLNVPESLLNPVSAALSLTGFATVAVKHSSKWQRASMPVDAAICAGMLVVSSGKSAT